MSNANGHLCFTGTDELPSIIPIRSFDIAYTLITVNANI